MVGKKTELTLQRAILTSDGMSTYGTKTWKDIKVYNGVLTVQKVASSDVENKFATDNTYAYRINYDPFIEIKFSDRFYDEKKELVYQIVTIENPSMQNKILIIGLVEK